MILTALQTALVARFEADAVLMALIPGGVWDGSVPEAIDRPYLVLDVPTEEPSAESFGAYGDLATIQFNTFGPETENSSDQANAILNRIELLLRTPLTVAGFTPPIARKEPGRTVLVEEDGVRHGVMRYRFTALEVPA